MKNLLLFIVLFFAFTACNDSDNGIDKAWKEANDKAYQEITKEDGYRELTTESGPNGIYYKVLQNGTGNEHPIQTSKVKVFYKGMYYDGVVFDQGTSVTQTPATFLLTSVVRGFSFALQNMVVGDKWDIWIPYYLGYGYSNATNSAGQLIMKGCTTLHFEVELVEIIQYPQ